MAERMRPMNRESTFASSDTLVVVDRSRRRRTIIIAAVAAVAVILIAFFMLTGGKDKQAGADGQAAAQVPAVTVVVPGRSEVARIITASGALAAQRDQPVGVA